MFSASELQEIRKAFAIEAAEMLAEMEGSLLALEVNPMAEEEFNRLFRTVHTIKGSSSIVQFWAVEQFCHTVEHLLVKVRNHEMQMTHPLLALLLRCHDHVNALMDQYCCTGSDEPEITLPPAHTHILGELEHWTSGDEKSETVYETLDESYFTNLPTTGDSCLNLFDDDEQPNAPEEDPPEAQQEAAEPSGAINNLAQKVVKVDATRLDQLSDLVVELVTASSVLEANVRRLGDLASSESAAHLANLIKQLQEKTMSFRMIPVQTLFQRFNRVIHDISEATGKKIRLQISGGEVEIDKMVAEKLHEPLLHLVRNAIDHGMESPSDRAAAGKPATGTLSLSALQRSGSIIIRVTDDGRGINLDRVLQKAVERDIARRDTMPTRQEILAYIFEPGFSTMDDATMLSGRGVGMDVVRRTVDSIRGSIEIETAEGSGTTFQISIPLSLTLIDGFMVSLAGTLYIIPMELIVETLELPSQDRMAEMPSGCLQVREELMPCLDLRTILGVDGEVPNVQHVVVFRNGNSAAGLVVDHLHGEIKTVIKPLGKLYPSAICVSGASILGDGSIALLLETGKLVEQARWQQRSHQQD